MRWLGLVASIIQLTWALALSAGYIIEIVCLVGKKTDFREALWRSFGRIHQELWLVAGPAIVLDAVHNWHTGSPWMVFLDALGLFNWWYARNWPDDNHWKRRAKKAKDAVTVRAGRLVVVPTS